MTKKAEKAASVEANKLAAYTKKVRSLLGHVFVSDLNVGVAYHAGLEAGDYAAQIASREPVGKAVHPLKAEAVEQAEKNCREDLAKIRAKLEAAGWDLNVVAPRPATFGPGAVSHDEYKRVAARRSRYTGVTRSVDANRSFHGTTDIVEMVDELCERRVQNWREAAAFSYDAFICKLVSKIGACETAELAGNHVWSNSVLTVTKAGDILEKWHTQEITNVSVLGLYFPQWPTRLLKGGA